MPRSLFEVMGDTNELIKPDAPQVVAAPVDTFVQGKSAQQYLQQDSKFQTAKAIESLIDTGLEVAEQVSEARIKSDSYDAQLQYQQADAQWESWKVNNQDDYQAMSPPDREKKFNEYFAPVVSKDFHPRVQEKVSSTISQTLYKESLSNLPADFERAVDNKANAVFDAVATREQAGEGADVLNPFLDEQLKELGNLYGVPQKELNALVREKAIADLGVGSASLYNYAEKYKMFGTSESIRAGDDKRLATARSQYAVAMQKAQLQAEITDVVANIEAGKSFGVVSEEVSKKAGEALEDRSRGREKVYADAYGQAAAASSFGQGDPNKALALKQQYRTEIARTARQFNALGIKNADHEQSLATGLGQLTGGASLKDSASVLRGLTIYETYKAETPYLLDGMLKSDQVADYEVALSHFKRDGMSAAIEFMARPKMDKNQLDDKVVSSDLEDAFDPFLGGFLRRPSNASNFAGEYVDYAISLQQRGISKSAAIGKAQQAFQTRYIKFDGGLIDTNPIQQAVLQKANEGVNVSPANIPAIFEKYIEFVQDEIPYLDNEALSFRASGINQYILVSEEGVRVALDDGEEFIDAVITTEELLDNFIK